MNLEDIIKNGESLFQSAQNVRNSARDMQALLDSVWERMKKREFFGEMMDLEDDYARDDFEWLLTAYAYNAQIMSAPPKTGKGRPPKSKPIGSISIIVRLCNPDPLPEDVPDWPWLNQACLIIAWCNENSADVYWSVGGFDLTSENKRCIEHRGNGVWGWQDDCSGHFYVLPLFALRGEAEIDRFVVNPLQALLNADDLDAASVTAFNDAPVLTPVTS